MRLDLRTPEECDVLTPALVPVVEIVTETAALPRAIQAAADRAALEAVGFVPDHLRNEGAGPTGYQLEAGPRAAARHQAAFEAMPTTEEACQGLIETIEDERRVEHALHPNEMFFAPSALGVRVGSHLWTPNAHRHAAPFLGYEKGIDYMAGLPQELRVQLLNHHASTSKRTTGLVCRERTFDGRDEVFTVVSKGYTPIDGDWVARHVADCAPRGSRAEVFYDGPDARGWVDVTCLREVDFPGVGELHSVGARFKFHDGVRGRVTGSIWCKRNSCANRSVFNATTVDLASLVHRGDVGVQLTKLRDLVQQAFSLDRGLGRITEAWGYAQAHEVTPVLHQVKGEEMTPWVELDAGQRIHALYEGMVRTGQLDARLTDVDGLAAAYWVEGSERITPFGIINGVTRYSQTVQNRWGAEALEASAGGLTWHHTTQLAYAHVRN